MSAPIEQILESYVSFRLRGNLGEELTTIRTGKTTVDLGVSQEGTTWYVIPVDTASM